MQIIKSTEDIKSLKNNKIIGAQNLALNNSEIRFGGEGNILFCEGNVRLYNSQLKFNGDNCVIYLSENSHAYYLDVTVYKNSAFYMGTDNYINGQLHAIASEQKNIIIGDDNLFAFGIWIRTADPHLVYSTLTNKRINPSKSALIGDRVWIGQAAMVLKGSVIGSGSIIGAMALVSGKTVPSNTSWGGNPARQIGENVFWSSDAVHMWDDEQTAAHETFSGEPYVYTFSEKENLSIAEIDKALEGSSAKAKVKYLKKLAKKKENNRFAQ